MWAPGDAAQCDLWFPPQRIPLEDGTAALLPVLVIVAAHSRFISGRDDPDAADTGSAVGDVVADRTVRAGAAPADLGQRDGDRPTQPTRRRSRRVLRHVGHKDSSAQGPTTPSRKASSSAATGSSRPRSCPGREFASPADFNAQFTDWLERANSAHGAHDQGRDRSIWSTPTGLRCCRCRRSRPRSAGRNQIRLGRDYYVRLDSNDYSVDPAVIGRQVDSDRGSGTGASPTRSDGSWLTMPGVWARHMTVTDPAHVATAKQLARSSSSAPGLARMTTALVRDLADYDRAFGLGERARGRVMATTKNAATVRCGQADPLPRRRV